MLCVPPWECSLKQRCGKSSSRLKPWHTFQKTPNFPEHQRISFHPIALIHGREDEYLSVEPGCPNFVPLVCRNTLNLKVSLPFLVPEVHIHLETNNQTWFLLVLRLIPSIVSQGSLYALFAVKVALIRGEENTLSFYRLCRELRQNSDLTGISETVFSPDLVRSWQER